MNTVFGLTGNHGFEFQLPAQYADGKPHTIYAYGIDVSGGNVNTLLTNSPKSILLMPPVKVTTFEYDNVGNRTRMTDETGYTNYEYDNLSRIKAETKHLRDSWTIAQHDFNIQYGYNLIGQLKSVTDPFGQRINYGTDKIGKLKEITGTPYDSTGATGTTPVTAYIDNVEYRAWGAVKSIDYGNSTSMSQTFDSRLRVEEFRLAKDGQTNSIIKKNYQYYNDNKLKFSSDTGDELYRTDSHRFDRSYSYDQTGRITAARTGTEARDETTTPDRNITPYKHDYIYNAFGNVTSRQTYTWNQADNKTHDWTNNKESTWLYDADGRLKHTDKNNYDYDASGAIMSVSLNGSKVSYNQKDGESRTVRRDNYNTRPANGFDTIDKTEYSIYSSVLGKLLTEVKSDGTKKTTYVYANGTLVATQVATATTGSQHVAWESTDPSNSSYVATLADGGILYSGERAQAELDPLGSNVGTSNPHDTGNLQAAPGGGGGWGNPFGGFSCRIDGFEAPCSLALQMLGNGSGGVDYNHSDSWALNSLGIAPIYDLRSTDREPLGPRNPDIVYVNTALEWYISGYHVWGFSLGNSNNVGIYDGGSRSQHGPSAQPDPPSEVDPCAGKKGSLNYDSRRKKEDRNGNWTARWHITDNHIDTEMEKNKSKYRSHFIPESGMFNYVTALNQATFQMATGYPIGNDKIMYIYAIPRTPGVVSFQLMIGKVGSIHSYANKWTNTNTLVLSNDCEAVITSYPGLPFGVRDDDYRITGTPFWTDYVPAVEVDWPL